MRLMVLGWLAVVLSSSLGAQAAIKAEVDAADIQRGLVRSTLTFQAKPGQIRLWYPKWIPGVHGPVGPVQNMAGFRAETRSGRALKWTRDDLQLYQFFIEVPANESEVIVRMDYICNQPSVNSVGVDSYGNSLMGIINFNTCLLYPDGIDIHEAEVDLSLRLPEGWKFGTSLPRRESGAPEGWIAFERRTFEEVVDSPVIMGKYLRELELRKEAPPVFGHFASESEGAIQLDDKYVRQLGKLADEAMVMFGSAPYEAYHFLVGASDLIPGIGLEHLNSSLNVVRERDLVEEKRLKFRAASLLPHELVHAWCGKYRRPAGMVTTNYHTDKRTGLLWVYEGLTTYLGDVLMVRSGQVTPEEYRQFLALDLARLVHTTGRQWRSLEDTAVASWQLRGRSRSWGLMRRSQDYYNEGLMVWLEIDGLIRSKTDNKKSLDDFCQTFFAKQPGQARVAGHDLEEIIAILNKLVPHDWEALIRRRVSEAQESLSLEVLPLVGYRLEYATKPSAISEERTKTSGGATAIDSLGVEVGSDGRITEVVPGLPGDKAGLAPGMQVEAINNRKFSRDRLTDALRDSVAERKVTFLVTEGDLYRAIDIAYADGPRYLEINRNPDRPDLLAEILKPRAKPEAKEK